MKKLANTLKSKQLRQKRRSTRIKKVIIANSDRPRLAVYKSNKYIYAQIIDDKNSCTVYAASDLKLTEGNKTQRAEKVGQLLAENAKKAGITKVAFDRNGYKYCGRVKALADSARSAGLEF